MMKIQMVHIISSSFLGLFLAQSLWAGTNNCGTVNCPDYCQSMVKILPGNTCTRQWDSNHSCYRADAYCSVRPGGPPPCATANCWDPCSNGFVPVTGNSCSQLWDPSSACFRAMGTCN